jgi:hypothetical protein
MGRSILAKSDNNGLDFILLYEVSRYKFINVSTAIVTRTNTDCQETDHSSSSSAAATAAPAMSTLWLSRQ